MKQKLLLTLLCLVFAINGKASDSGYDFEVGKFHYNIISSEESIVELTSSPTEKYSGSITIPETVTNDGKTYRVGRIAENAFSNCTELTEVVMSNNIEYIGMNAFMGCTALTNVKLSENIDELYHGVFANCTSLKEIVIPDNVRALYGHYSPGGGYGYYSTFANCSSLETLTLGIHLSHIVAGSSTMTRGMGPVYEYDPFCGTSTRSPIKKVIVRSEKVKEVLIQTLGESVEEVILENTVREVEDGAFANFGNLKRLIIDEDCTLVIGDEAFRGCSNLTDLILAEGLESIGANAFYDCSSLLKVDIPKSVKAIGDYAFGNCTSLARITVGDSIVSMGSDPFIDTRWYNNRPDGEIYIGKVLLAYRTMPANTTLRVKDGTVCIASFALSSQNNLDSLYIPNSVVSVGDGICSNCKSLRYVDLPDELKTIGASSFYRCENLSTVEWPGNLDLIDEAAFYGCKSLNALYLPNTVGVIGKSAFSACESLKDVNLPQSLKEIGESAFSSCPMYEDVVIPNSVVSIGAYAFSDGWSWADERMKRVTIPHSVEYIDETAFSDTPLGYLNVNSDYLVREMPAYFAQLAATPTEVVFGDSVTTIIPSVMENNKTLSSVTFGTNVKEIGDFAFCSCTSLSEIILLTKEIPTAGMDCFLNLAKDCKIYVPDPEAYREAWPEYAHMIVDIAGVVHIEEQTFTYTGQAPEIGYTSKVPVNVVFDELMVDAGTYEAKGQAIFTLGDETVTRTVNCTYTIGKAPLYVVAADTSRVYGEENPEFEVSLYGFVNEEDGTVLTSLPTAHSDATAESNVGEYVIYTIGGEAKNYEFVRHTAILTVEKAEQVIIWELESDTVVVGTQLELTATATSGLQVYYFDYDALEEGFEPELEGLYIQDGKFYLDCSEVGVLHILAFQNGMMGESENYHTAYAVKELVVVEPEIYTLTILDTEEEFAVEKIVGCETITYIRDFTDTNWQTLYVPFEIPVTEDFLGDFEIADLNNVHQYDHNDDGVTDETVIEAFKVTSGVLEVNYPYLIRAKEVGEKSIIVTDAVLYTTKENSIDCSSVREMFTFTGTYSTLSSDALPQAEGYYTLNGGVWQPVTEGMSLGAFRFYLKVDGRVNNTTMARTIRMRIVGENGEDDDATGIVPSTDDSQQTTVIYDLMGRRVESAVKGVYIINGKKVAL